MKEVKLKDILFILDEKFLLASKRENYEIMTLVVDIKKQVLDLSEHS